MKLKRVGVFMRIPWPSCIRVTDASTRQQCQMSGIGAMANGR